MMPCNNAYKHFGNVLFANRVAFISPIPKEVSSPICQRSSIAAISNLSVKRTSQKRLAAYLGR